MGRTSGLLTVLQALAVAGASLARADEAPRPPRPFRVTGEAKLSYRDSAPEETAVRFPFPKDFLPPEGAVFQRTVASGRSLELSNVRVLADGDLSSNVAARVAVHFLDLHNRNPTSSDDRVFVREAWVRFGPRPEVLEEARGSSFYVLAGMAPRFTRQAVRRLESYGLWGTAVGRFEQPQVQVGAQLGGHVYLRGLVGGGNPLFFRDPNALAGDNGTPERVPGNVNPIYQSGFPILYDAKATDVGFDGKLEWGAGLGVRLGGGEDRPALDMLAWYFQRELADTVRLRGTFYSGDLKLLRGVAFPLPFRGNEKWEAGLNVEARAGGLRLFGQLVDQEIAELPRRGYEAELSYHVSLGGLFLVGESPFGHWIQLAARVSSIDNRFEVPREYPAPSVGWDWRKYDLGLRFGLVASVDLTVEYARHDMILRDRTLHPDETLLTLRVGF